MKTPLDSYIKSYDFSTSRKLLSQTYFKKLGLERYLNHTPEENLISFVNDFWDAPDTPIYDLRKKHNIKTQLKYGHILKAYPTDKYINLLNVCFSQKNEISSKYIRETYNISYNRLDQLLWGVVIDLQNYFCPICYYLSSIKNSEFYITSSIPELNKSLHHFECIKCGGIIYSFEYDSFLHSINL